jgi:hypothetical protein
MNMIADSSPAYVVFLFCGGLMAALVAVAMSLDSCVSFKMTLIPVAVSGSLYGWMFNVTDTVHYRNEPVVAEKVNAYTINEQSGKHSSELHGYVVYRLPNGEEVMFRAGQGMVYPKTATLYKQDK